MSIRIFYDDTSFRLKGWKRVLKIIQELIAKEKRIAGEVNLIITNDENLKAINIEFLEHDYYTDVITFNYNNEEEINGEVYISLDRVKENSINYNVSFEQEMFRVIIHGILHLNGYDDKDEEARSVMRSMEDYWLGLVKE